MSNAFTHLLEPVALGGLALRNRVIMVPMGTEMGDHDGHLTDREIAYYAERAKGGVGLVVTGINAVTDDYEVINAGLGRIDSDAAIPGLTALAEAVHAVDGRISVQLTAGLGRNINTVDPDRAPISASDNPHYSQPDVICRPLTTDEIAVIVQRFEDAARRCLVACIDAIDIHGHTGYLIDQFLSPQWNRRTDEYGGSAENRARFATEIIAAVKRGAPGLPVSFRLSVDHRYPGGRTVEDSREIAVALEAAGLDLLMADEGSYEAMDYVFPPYYLGDDCMMDAAIAMKRVVTIPVLGCGNLTPERAESAIASGEMDFAGIGRALIADPEWTSKLAAGRRDDIRPCVRCNQLCVGNAFVGKPLGCAVNPTVGYERERVIVPAETPKRVVVIGAGPAGLEAARVAALRGHTVDVYERTDRLGGVLWPAATPEFKKELRAMIFWWERQLAALPVTIHLGSELDADAPEIAAADHVIVAVGSTPLLPSIPGLDGDNVVEVIDAHLEPGVLGTRLVVCGGGLSGADFALEAAQAGHEVTVVEMAEAVAKDLLMINRITLLRDLEAAGVTLLTGARVTGVGDDGVTVETAAGTAHVAADTVVSAFGVRPATTIATALADRQNVVSIGDCVRPAKVGDAINAGFEAAFAI